MNLTLWIITLDSNIFCDETYVTEISWSCATMTFIFLNLKFTVLLNNVIFDHLHSKSLSTNRSIEQCDF